jgi:hypothetical protein
LPCSGPWLSQGKVHSCREWLPDASQNPSRHSHASNYLCTEWWFCHPAVWFKAQMCGSKTDLRTLDATDSSTCRSLTQSRGSAKCRQAGKMLSVGCGHFCFEKSGCTDASRYQEPSSLVGRAPIPMSCHRVRFQPADWERSCMHAGETWGSPRTEHDTSGIIRGIFPQAGRPRWQWLLVCLPRWCMCSGAIKAASYVPN